MTEDPIIYEYTPQDGVKLPPGVPGKSLTERDWERLTPDQRREVKALTMFIPVELSQDSGTDDPDHQEMVTGYLAENEIIKWTRAELEAIAVDMGISDAADKSVYPNKDALIAKLITIPEEVPAADDGEMPGMDTEGGE